MQSTAPSNLEIKGSLAENPFAEVLCEFSEARLSGSFRLSNEAHKVIVYLKQGDIVFAVSNLRQHRLFDILLQSGKIQKEILGEIKDFTNDMALAEALRAKAVLSKTEIDQNFSYQIWEIIRTVLNWTTGEWVFSPLARIKDSINFEVDRVNLMVDYARNLPVTNIIRRFKSFEENFGINESKPAEINLLPKEAFMLSRFGSSLMRVKEAKNLSGFSDEDTLRTLYILWLGTFLLRRNWNSILSENKIRHILSAKLSLVREAEESAPVKPEIKLQTSERDVKPEPLVMPEEDTSAINEEEAKRLRDQYLDRVENSNSYYEMLDVPVEATLMVIKASYFKLAKSFHPDKYHQENDSGLQQRIQNAFTEIARAYETLKDPEKRETYNYRLRKYLETAKITEKVTASRAQKANATAAERANEEFEQGFDYLMNEEYEESLPFFIRAIQMSPNVAKYHAYYGKALSFDDKQRHKAESELQAAVKLDQNTATFRIMLVEFYIQVGLMRRAEGELQRLLTQFPNNREAMVLLESLPGK